MTKIAADGAPESQIAIRLDGIGYAYGKVAALDGVGFTVDRGRFCALLGPNGAGKSTLFSLLTRLFVTSTGRIEVAGIDLARNPRAALAKIGVVFQQQTLDLDLTVRRNLSYFAALQGLSGKDSADRIDRSLERLGLRDRAGEKTRSLSGGYRRRTEIARALLHDPQVLLLDEATIGLDAASRKEITDHVHTLCTEDGLTALWATHLVDEVRPDDELAVLHKGRLVARGIAGDLAGEAGLLAFFTETTRD